MGLPRSQEPFHRVYSPPEPPAAARRRFRPVTVLMILVPLCVAAGLVVLFLPRGDENHDAARPTPQPSSSAAPTGGARTTPPSRSAPERVPMFTALPAACGTVSQATVRRLIPQAKSVQSANNTFTTCTYAAQRGGFRWLRVEARLYSPSDTPTPVKDAQQTFQAQLTQARNDSVERTVSLTPQYGLGDEAYRRFKVDKGQPTAVGEVGVRLRNAVITVSYSEETVRKNDPGSAGQRLLSESTGVAREVLLGFR